MSSFSNTGRASPFRRPDSSSPTRSPSTLRASTPQPGSPLKNTTTAADSNNTALLGTRPQQFSPAAAQDRSWLSTRGTTMPTVSPPSSPSRNATRSPLTRDALALNTSSNNLNAHVADDAMSSADSPRSAQTVRPLFSARSNTMPVAALFNTSTPAAAQESPQPAARPLPVTTASATIVEVASPKKAPATGKASDPLLQIPHHYLHTMRESFAVLDRSNTGTIDSADVLAQLSELGLDTSPAALAEFFPTNSKNGSMNLSTYLHTLSSDLATLSRKDELLNALSAFDDDDSGQVDLSDLHEALSRVMPDAASGPRLSVAEINQVMEGFTGKRAFKKGGMMMGMSGMKDMPGAGLGRSGNVEREKKDVFRYQDFVGGIWGAEQQQVVVAGKEAA